ncbi:uncharacterized protein Hap1MRO34_015456 isoform 1-T4 [Clarias gariepinus]|uniref:uncharacterized protein si:ch73-204p21.2 n=1 Tax=Clarias gariepinus TaxID=13013 RepID=UPI00234CA46E|nr:uncharacterized protein si:ch73-204p21.2 [Clarias gariepinus]XP_053366183.1 uncharacterized protein si:ch73-204p21.2 [Clarias gariepinus]XP_053366184.1 uncharacterized protein si:ch73-204p21.2 [Clarias gariepinus]XP_053366185.1 uncharacterized protein si:ch73-204p21.2 [Clarias gariepinus]
MAPIYIAPQTWDALNLPGLAFLSVVILFILTITLLALCSSCQRQSFSLESSSNPSVERSTSTLVRVVNPMTKEESPAPERHLAVLPEELPDPIKQWRSHTFERNTQPVVNGALYFQ